MREAGIHTRAKTLDIVVGKESILEIRGKVLQEHFNGGVVNNIVELRVGENGQICLDNGVDSMKGKSLDLEAVHNGGDKEHCIVAN